MIRRASTSTSTQRNAPTERSAVNSANQAYQRRRMGAASAITPSSEGKLTTDQAQISIHQNYPAYRPARPPPRRHLRQRGGAAWWTRRDTLALSPGFSYFWTSDG